MGKEDINKSCSGEAGGGKDISNFFKQSSHFHAGSVDCSYCVGTLAILLLLLFFVYPEQVPMNLPVTFHSSKMSRNHAYVSVY